jgi:toxin ParE1/3/4
MAEIKFTERALKDIDETAEYIARNSNQFARKFASSIFEKVKIIQNFPKIGRIVDEFGIDEIREIFYHQYRIVYHIISEKEIHILTIQHSSRNFRDTISNF